MNIGYCRVSTIEQNLDLQLDALKKAGCDRIFEDKASGSKDDREGLQMALKFARGGDCIIVWRLDRLGRNLSHLIETINSLSSREVSFRSLTESIDSSTPSGRLVLHIFASLAEFERALLRERTKAGLEAARARGRLGGRPKALNDIKIAMLKNLMMDPGAKVDDVAKLMGISRSSIYRYLSTIPASSSD